MINRNEVCAIVVSYNGLDTINSTVNSIEKMVDQVFIVDNGSSKETKVILKELVSETISITELEKNFGIAYALNKGFEKAILLNYKWVITLDQDSVFNEDSVKRMYEINANGRYKEDEIGIICPKVCYDTSKIFLKKIKQKESDIKEKTVVITSGNLVNVDAYKLVNGFENKLFIDNVDFDFCLKLRSLGYRIIEIDSAILLHSLGKEETIKLLNFSIKIQTHNSIRKYYMSRNHIYIIKKYFNRFPILILKLNIFFFIFLVQTFILERQQFQSFKMITKGLHDGINNKFNDIL